MSNVFIASPIAGFESKTDYKKYRLLIKNVIEKIKALEFIDNVFSEIVEINDIINYDSPQNSVLKDFYNILHSDFFILFYPQKVSSSALIELGYAIAERKKILILSPKKEILPYLVPGLDKVYNNVTINIEKYSEKNILRVIKKFLCL